MCVYPISNFETSHQIMSNILILQKHLIQLVEDQAYRSADILAQGLLIEAPATTALASSQNAPIIGTQ